MISFVYCITVYQARPSSPSLFWLWHKNLNFDLICGICANSLVYFDCCVLYHRASVKCGTHTRFTDAYCWFCLTANEHGVSLSACVCLYKYRRVLVLVRWALTLHTLTLYAHAHSKWNDAYMKCVWAPPSMKVHQYSASNMVIQIMCDRIIFTFYLVVQRVLFHSQVLGSRAAEKEAWSESQAAGGHLQVSLMETVSAGSVASHRGECVCVVCVCECVCVHVCACMCVRAWELTSQELTIMQTVINNQQSSNNPSP